MAAKQKEETEHRKAQHLAEVDATAEREELVARIRQETYELCVQQLSDSLFALIDGLLSGMAGQAANNASIRDRQAHMLGQMAQALSSLPMDFEKIRLKYQLARSCLPKPS
jgi:hypothetical protein